MQDSPAPGAAHDLPPDLLEHGRRQLEAEIRILESWLRGLAGTREDNAAAIAVRHSYNDMLQRRRDLLATLKNHLEVGGTD